MKKFILVLMIAALLLPAMSLAEELHKLTEPAELLWGTYYLDEGGTAPYPGMISFRATDLEYNHKIEVEVCCKGVYGTLHRGVWRYRARNSEHPYITEHDFINNGIDLESGDYYFMVRAMGDGETTANSAWVTSDVWTYVRPEKQLAAPVNLRWDNNTAWWDAVQDEDVGGYSCSFYYSAEHGDLTSYKDTDDRIVAFVRYRMNGFTYHCWEQNMEFFEKPGYYYFTVNTVSGDMTKAIHSEDSELSPAIYWNGTAFVQ